MSWPATAAMKHGFAKRGQRAPEYGVWANMLKRCRNPASGDYENYGGRGITVCEQWQDFAAFIADMGPRPTPMHTIERLDNDAGYTPANCVWATRDVQSRNRRPRRQQVMCGFGHEFTVENTYQRPEGKRGCRACRAKNMLRFYARKKQKESASD